MAVGLALLSAPVVTVGAVLYPHHRNWGYALFAASVVVIIAAWVFHFHERRSK